MAHATHIEPHIGAKCAARDLDPAIATLSRRQHGVVSRRQLLELGMGRRAIGHRLERGRLHHVHRGVYAVGHDALSERGRWMAAVLAGGPGAVLSHRSAAALWRIAPSSRARTELGVPGRRGKRPGIQFHETHLPTDEVTVHDGIPVTTVARTLLDLAVVVDERQVERAINEAEVLRLWDEVSLAALTERYPRRAGTGKVREALRARQDGPTLTRNDLEEMFLAAVRHASLPSPEVNAALVVSGHSYEIDFLWRKERLAVELDGSAAHGTRAAFEADRQRDRILSAAGWRPVRFTWRQLDRVSGELPLLLGTVSPCAP
jgi:very-short-patch-repair endonuclease/predicted transcriptional regulator of viral defense system